MSNNDPLLQWESFPLVENSLRSLLVFIYLILAISLVWLITIVIWETPLFYVLGVILLICPLLTYFIPTYYKLYDDKIVVIYLFIKIERKYTDFGCYYIDKKGVMLSTFKVPRWLDSYRGQSLRFSKDQTEKEKLLTILDEKIGNRK